MLSSDQKLSISYLIIFPFILTSAVYNLIRHGKHGILGWGYLTAFCTLRLAGSGLEVVNPADTTASILIGVGLSPLVLAALGVLHEATHYGSNTRPFVLRTPFYIILHLVAGLALGLLVSGSHSSSGFTSGRSRAGYVLFLLIWLVLVGLCIPSFPLVTNRQPKLLLTGVAISLIFLGIRVVYGIVGSFDESVNAYTGDIAYRVVFDALDVYLNCVILACVGIVTRNIQREAEQHVEANIPLQQHNHMPHPPPLKDNLH